MKEMTLPNKLTIFRMILTPVFVAVLLHTGFAHHYLAGLVIFAIASITDALDGKIARKYELTSVFGKMADPIADKMLTTCALLCFMKFGLCSIWIIIIVLSREFTVTSIRLVASAEGTVIPANIWGKVKTATQMTFIILIMLMGELAENGILPASFPLVMVSQIMLWVTAVLTVVSGCVYVYNSRGLIDFSAEKKH